MMLRRLDHAYLNRRIADVQRHLEAELQTALEAYTATLRTEFRKEIGELTDRVDHVHRRALRAMTASLERRQPR